MTPGFTNRQTRSKPALVMAQLAHKPGFAGFHDDFRAFVLVAIEPDVLGLAHEAMKDPGEFGDPLDIANAGGFARRFAGEFLSFPGGDQIAGFAQEQNFALPFVIRVGKHHQDGFLLLDSGEVEEVRVRCEAQGAVSVGGEDVVGVDDGDGTGGQEAHQTSAIADEQLGIDRRVSHAGDGGPGFRPVERPHFALGEDGGPSYKSALSMIDVRTTHPTRRPGLRSWRRIVPWLLAGLAVTPPIRAEESEPWVSLGPLIQTFPLTLEPGDGLEAAGPFYYRLDRENDTLWAVPPLISSAVSDDGERSQMFIVPPLFSYRRYGD
ncbi:MAG: hypothetical protein L6Q38_19940, partial [Nitrospira sp.]|nr:hypothetical protein [Nitrospira sp.]